MNNVLSILLNMSLSKIYHSTLWYVKTICWQQTIKDFLKVNDTATCDIRFSLASNSHSNFYTKIAFDWISLKIACLSKQRIHFSWAMISKTLWLALFDLYNFFYFLICDVFAGFFYNSRSPVPTNLVLGKAWSFYP